MTRFPLVEAEVIICPWTPISGMMWCDNDMNFSWFSKGYNHAIIHRNLELHPSDEKWAANDNVNDGLREVQITVSMKRSTNDNEWSFKNPSCYFADHMCLIYYQYDMLSNCCCIFWSAFSNSLMRVVWTFLEFVNVGVFYICLRVIMNIYLCICI